MEASEFFSALPDVLMDFLNTVKGVFVDLVDSFMVPVVEALPDTDIPLQQFYRFFGLLDRFFAINYALTLFIAWATFVLSVALVNWCLGLIPGEN